MFDIPYVDYERKEWASLCHDRAIALADTDLAQLQGVNSPISQTDVCEVYLPLVELLRIHIKEQRQRAAAASDFLGRTRRPAPFLIGLAGSVSVGKSTTARLLQFLLGQNTSPSRVDLVTTDGFLYPNKVLSERQIMHRKGFPESYDVASLMQFVVSVRRAEEAVPCPVYSHVIYDLEPDKVQIVDRPDVMILEGLNVLQTGSGGRRSRMLVSDLLDFTIYVDAEPEHISRWFEERFLLLRDTAFRDPQSYFRNYANLDDSEARSTAQRIWREINEVNLQENILPTRERANLILEKGRDHNVERVRLRVL